MQKFASPIGFFGVVILVFIYDWLGAAPTITFEDAGDLALAVRFQGVAHPPGYPLWTLIGQSLRFLFPTSDLPRVLVMFSVVTSALSAGVLFSAVEKFLHRIGSVSRFLSFCLSFLSVLWIYSSAHIFRQSVIIEVYGLHLLICSGIFWSFFKWTETKKSFYFYLFSLLFGLGLSNHHLILAIGLGFLIYFILFERDHFFKLSGLTNSFIFLGVGLIPYLYLWTPHSWQWDWGDIHDGNSFWQHVTRMQYVPHLQRNWYIFIEQTREQVILLLKQLNPGAIFTGIFGLIFLPWSFRIWVILLFFVTGPLTSWLVNFAIPIGFRLSHQDVSSLLSVFFLTHYQVWAFALAFGCLQMIQSVSFGSRKKLELWMISFGILALSVRMMVTFQNENMRNYGWVPSLVQNWETLVQGQPSLILVNWDPFSFGPSYFSLAENRLQNVQLVDVEMLKSPWYLKMTERRYPELVELARPEFNKYQELLARFLENKWPGGAEELDGAFVSLVRKLIFESVEKRNVYLAVSRDFKMIDPRLIQGFVIRSEYVLARVTSPDVKPESPHQVGFYDFDYGTYTDEACENDRLTQMMALYYGQLLIESISSLGLSEAGYDAALLKLKEMRKCAPELNRLLVSVAPN